MFYKMIRSARERWYNSPACSVNTLISYIERTGQMRDAQIDAIKTYLFLKIACNARPLAELFSSGRFNSLDLDELELTSRARDFMKENKAAAALYEYACLTDKQGAPVSEKLAAVIRNDPGSIPYKSVFHKLFYGVDYPDYLFSLPMGAGKTFLMAAFIYLDLYFAQSDPQNPAFAHNFIIFAPSGLKSSVIPSLKTIQKFDPTWVIPEPAASNIRHRMSFEILDQTKTAAKSNKTKNPNVQKVAGHQPFSDLFGLVIVANAEKVILDNVKDGAYEQLTIPEDIGLEENRANELRDMLGKLPALSVFIDEVHHAVNDKIKLRSVVNRWAVGGNLRAVVGFSGTPYLNKAEKISVTENLSVGAAEITNVVYFYPLIDGIGNFLKTPVVKISNVPDSAQIIEAGLRYFLDTYRDTAYDGGLTAKLGIYCGSIAKLEELVYPLVTRVAAEYGLPPKSVLRFYRKSSGKDPAKQKYTAPADSQMLFDTLDKPGSPVRIVLLVQIGKEGWDCRSLTGIILSQEGDCPNNMVLQTSCRCLRQVVKGSPESAVIYLNEYNADKLNAQLLQEQNISLHEFSSKSPSVSVTLNRYDRTDHLKLPKLDFYQLKIQYETLVTDNAPNTAHDIEISADKAHRDSTERTTDLTMETLSTKKAELTAEKQPVTFRSWLYSLEKSSFGYVTPEMLRSHTSVLHKVFDAITEERSGLRYFNPYYDRPLVETNIRRAFCGKRSFSVREEYIPEAASLLDITHFTAQVVTERPERYYPSQDTVAKIHSSDNGAPEADENTRQLIEFAESIGRQDIAAAERAKFLPHPQAERSFHYLPYHMDSQWEQSFFDGDFGILKMSEIEKYGLEVYYNGDRALTEFKIACYKRNAHGWSYIGNYTPDFLILQRKDGTIHKAIIVETKGNVYEAQFADKRHFMETAFLQQNNEIYGYKRFDFLYLPDTLTPDAYMSLTRQKICEFFEEVTDHVD